MLKDVSWRLYTQLLSEAGESPGTRITYHGGRLQITVVSAGRDNPNRTISEIVSFACLETGTDYCPLGSTTFKREDLLKGFEPDATSPMPNWFADSRRSTLQSIPLRNS